MTTEREAAITEALRRLLAALGAETQAWWAWSRPRENLTDEQHARRSELWLAAADELKRARTAARRWPAVRADGPAEAQR